MTLRLNLVKETSAAVLYAFKDGTQHWIPRSQIRSRLKFPGSISSPEVHEVTVSDWWWDKFMEEEEPNE